MGSWDGGYAAVSFWRPFREIFWGEMGSLQGPVICPAVQAKQTGVCTLPVNGPLVKPKVLKSGFLGCRDNFSENDEDYVNSSVVEAVEVKCGSDGFIIKMRDGKHVRCVHNTPQGGHLLDYVPHPAIVLKMEDGTGLLLPIIVLEMPSVLLMAAIRNVPIARPTMYQIVKEMVDKMGYAVKFVRVTKRVHEAYFAQLCLTKLDNEAERISFDLRPSDAINIAVRCKVPIQVNKNLAFTDGMRVIESGRASVHASSSDGLLFTELDRPSSQPCIETMEFNLLQSMLNAVVEERYKDAAELKAKLTQLRSKKNWA
ncbi:hypothetical protein Vadar_012493 [Vaccinium darrowii]|uniref:Uncharacterized protein n=1 Tax=Vaccinium darrowii TaxID=229202 RepID=A0ACB7Y7S6_9ERIC|nr:hypothetical protein Vadar_012493 [Vaccinium darrowii]